MNLLHMLKMKYWCEIPGACGNFPPITLFVNLILVLVNVRQFYVISIGKYSHFYILLHSIHRLPAFECKFIVIKKENCDFVQHRSELDFKIFALTCLTIIRSEPIEHHSNDACDLLYLFVCLSVSFSLFLFYEPQLFIQFDNKLLEWKSADLNCQQHHYTK